MDWDAEGLLEDLPDERARRRGGSCWTSSTRTGWSWTSCKQAVKEERLALLPLERLLGGEQRYTLREIAEESGLELSSLEATRRALGLAVTGPDDPIYNEDDLEAARLGLRRPRGRLRRGPHPGDQPGAGPRDGALRRGAADAQRGR